MADKRAIKVSTLDRLAEGFQESRGITDKLTIEQMIAFAKEPVGGGENKLNQLLTKTITEITAEDTQGITEISEYAFNFCRYLETIDLPNSLRTLGQYCFRGCYRLTELRLPEGCTNLPNGCLSQGTGWASKTGEFNIYLPSTITEVGYPQFGQTSNPNPENMAPSGSKADVNVYFATQNVLDIWMNKAYKNEIGRPNGNLRFYVNGERVNKITIPSNVTKIPQNTFPLGLDVDVVCEGNITQAFTDMRGIKSISFPNNTQVPTLRNYLSLPYFNVDILEKIEVPATLYEQWISATNWADWADYIVSL